MTGKQYHFFYGVISPFSNFHPSKIYYDILKCDLCSVEHGYILNKLLILGDFNKIEELKVLVENNLNYKIFMDLGVNPDLEDWHNLQCRIKEIGRKAKGNIKAWDKVKFRIMEGLVEQKFNQNEHLKLDLINTEGQFVEASPYDRIWGIGYSKHDALSNVSDWGENNLGKILDKVREKFL